MPWEDLQGPLPHYANKIQNYKAREVARRRYKKLISNHSHLSSSSLSEGKSPGPPKRMPPAAGGGGIELKGQAFRGGACIRGGKLEVASSFSSGSLAGELDDEWASQSFFRLCFPSVAAGFGCSSVASVISTFSSSGEVAKGIGESSIRLTSSSKAIVLAVGPFSGRGGREDLTE